MSETIDALARELAGEEGTFLEAFFGARWDDERFLRLARLLALACRELEGATVLDRALAAGVWYLDTTLTARGRGHPFVEQQPVEYLEDALEKVTLLASWFFEGECPFEDPSALDAEIDALARA
jgi:hypothetical protein